MIDLNEKTLFENTNIILSNTGNISDSLFIIIGDNLNELKYPRIKFLNISFNDNIGTIFKTETINDNLLICCCCCCCYI